MSDEASQRYVKSTAADTELSQLVEFIKNCWPENSKKIPGDIKKYANFREELAYEGGLVYKGERIVVPRNEIKSCSAAIHSGHQGIVNSLKRARSHFYWHGQSTDVRNFVEKCTSCQRSQRSSDKEPIYVNEIPQLPLHCYCRQLFWFFRFRETTIDDIAGSHREVEELVQHAWSPTSTEI